MCIVSLTRFRRFLVDDRNRIVNSLIFSGAIVASLIRLIIMRSVADKDALEL